MEDAGDQRDQNQEHEAETSHTDERVGLNTAGGGDDVETGSKGEVAEPSMREVLEAVKLMGAHMVTLTQAFTPLVNSSVGQVTPPVRVAARATGDVGIRRSRLEPRGFTRVQGFPLDLEIVSGPWCIWTLRSHENPEVL